MAQIDCTFENHQFRRVSRLLDLSTFRYRRVLINAFGAICDLSLPFVRQNFSPLSFIDVPERVYVEGLLGVYELNRVDLLRDVFVWAYERSAQHYVAIRQSLGDPDRFRLKFRNELTEVVGEIVRGGLAPTVEEVTDVATTRVPPEQMDDFVRMTIRDLENLHEGNFARFRLRPSEYSEWRKLFPLKKGTNL